MSTTTDVPASSDTATTGDGSRVTLARIPIVRDGRVVLLVVGDGPIATISELTDPDGMSAGTPGWPRHSSEIRADLETVLHSPERSAVLHHLDPASEIGLPDLQALLEEQSDEEIIALVERLPEEQLDSLASLLVCDRPKVERKIDHLRRRRDDDSLFRKALRRIVQMLKAMKQRLEEVQHRIGSPEPALISA